MNRYPRYPQYKDSGVEWIGEVPAHWDVIALKRLGTLKGGTGFPPDMQGRSGNELPFYKVGDLSRSPNGITLGETEHSISRKEASILGATIFPANVLVWAKIGAALLLNRRRIVPTASCLDNNMTGFIPNPSKASTKFCFYLLSSIDFSIHAKPGAVPSFSEGDQGELHVTCPSIAEQSIIADFLDRETARIDALIAKKTRFIELLKEKRAALITHAVTKGLDPEVKMKDSGVKWIGEVPAHWSVVPIKYVATVGNGSTPNKDKDRYWENGTFPWLTSGCVNHDEVWHAEQYVTEAALRECHLPIITPPAVLVGITGQGKTRGMASTLKIEATINQHIAYLKPMPKSVHVEFLRRFLDASYEWLRFDSEGVGSTKGAITCEQLSNTKISVPPRAEQEAILDWIRRRTERFNQLHLQTQRSIDLLQERRSAFITAAVTGQIDVRRSV